MQEPSKNSENNECITNEGNNPTVTPTEIPTPTPTITIEPSITKTPHKKTSSYKSKYNYRPTIINSSLHKKGTSEYSKINIPKEHQKDYSRLLPWIAGSNSLLSAISLVFKTYIFRYT